MKETPAAERVKISDGTTWTIPVDCSLAWKLIHTDSPIDGGDRMMLAGLLESYTTLLVLARQGDAYKKLKGLREALRRRNKERGDE